MGIARQILTQTLASDPRKARRRLPASGLTINESTFTDSPPGSSSQTKSEEEDSELSVDKTRDLNPPDEQLFLSEILWQSWLLVMKKQKARPANLRALISLMVVNPSSRVVI